MIDIKPDNLIGGIPYDIDNLGGELNGEDVEMIAPHRTNR